MAASAPYSRRAFSGGGITTTIPLGVPSSSQASFALAASTNWSSGASGTYFAVLDRGLTSEEKVEITSLAGSIVTIAQRGADGSAASIHASGCTITLCHVARDDDEANQAVSQTLGTVTTIGDLLYASSVVSNAVTFARVGIGTAGQVFKVNAGGTAPIWQNPGGYSAGTAGPPIAGTFAQGAIWVDSTNVQYMCTVAGTPGTWQEVGPTQNAFSGVLSMSTALASNTPVDLLDTASLSIGTWYITMCMMATTADATSGLAIQASVKTGTATLSGCLSATANISGSLAAYESMVVSFLATVTGAAVVKLTAQCSGASGGTAVVAGTVDNLAVTGATGWTAIRIA